MNPRNRNILIAVIVVVIVVVGGFFAFHKSGKKADTKTVNIGIMTPTKQDKYIWNTISEQAKDKYGIKLKFTNFTDYTQPNKALEAKSIDLNAFQHYAFLKAWNDSNKTDIFSIGDDWITPIHLYSDKVSNVSDLSDGAQIAIPNDSSNESRALYVLEGQGLIKLNVSGDTLASVKNITSNPKNIVIKTLDASQIARALSSVDAAVINTNYAQAAGITFKKSIASEPLNANSKQWVNLIAARKADKNNKIYKDVVKALQTEAVKKAIKKEYPDGSQLAAWDLKF